MGVTAILFPGQGSQTPDMRDTVSEVRPDLLSLVEPIVGEDPFVRAEEGARFAQPAIFCASLAGCEALGRPDGDMMAGHSLGGLAQEHGLTVANDNSPQQVVLSGDRSAFEAALARVEIATPRVTVLSAVTATPFEDVRAQLAQALTMPVRWRGTLLAMRERGGERFVEVGPGRVLTGLVKRTLKDVELAHA
jgi:[acyl-carrier-protein] S-malonyltransferase